MILTSMYGPIRQADGKLIVRDFMFDSASQKGISAVMEELPPDVIISLKDTPHDYYPALPANPRIDRVGDHEQWIEFNIMGQYFGWGMGIADLAEDYRRRLSDARQKGASRTVFRLDWESLDGRSSFFIPNKIDVYAGAALTRGLDTPNQEIYRGFLPEEGRLEDIGCTSRQARWLSSIMKKIWEAIAGTVFIDDCVLSGSSMLPIPLEHAVWLPEEKNSLKDWDPRKQDCVSPRRSFLEPAIREKEEVFKRTSALYEEAGEYPEGLDQNKVRWSQERLALNARHVDMYRCGTEVILLTRYVTEIEEQDKEFRQSALEGARQVPLVVNRMKRKLTQFFRETGYEPHMIYTLLDPDRLDCLYRKLSTWLSGD